MVQTRNDDSISKSIDQLHIIIYGDESVDCHDSNDKVDEEIIGEPNSSGTEEIIHEPSSALSQSTMIPVRCLFMYMGGLARDGGWNGIYDDSFRGVYGRSYLGGKI